MTFEQSLNKTKNLYLAGFYQVLQLCYEKATMRDKKKNEYKRVSNEMINKTMNCHISNATINRYIGLLMELNMVKVIIRSSNCKKARFLYLNEICTPDELDLPF